MATTRLSDVVVPEVYRDYITVDDPELTAFYQSGIVVRNEMFDSQADGPSNIVNMPFWRDLDQTVAPNLSTDNPADIATPNKVTAGNMLARTAYLNQGYSDADLVVELNGSDPMRRIRSRFSTYWERQWQRRLIAASRGILANNILPSGSGGNNGDMVHAVGDQFSREGFTSAMFTMGDHVGELTAIAVHSAVMKQMVDQDGIEYIKPSEGSIPIPTFMGRRVIMDDSLPAISVAPDEGTVMFTSVLFGGACFGYGNGSPSVPVEVDRKPEQGMGGGIEILWERKTWLLHPFGFSFTSASVAGQSATLDELATAANWSRVVPRKNVPMAFLTSTLTKPE